ncbi:MAG: hypothetical protein R2705_13110 [Ilumatobacteraceae bacterium]
MRSSREVDIQDLRDRQSASADIDAMYDRLEAGSENHLRRLRPQPGPTASSTTPKYSTRRRRGRSSLTPAPTAATTTPTGTLPAVG